MFRLPTIRLRGLLELRDRAQEEAEAPIMQGGAYAPARRREPRPRLPPPPVSAQAEPEVVGGTFCFPRRSSRGLEDEEEQ